MVFYQENIFQGVLQVIHKTEDYNKQPRHNFDCVLPRVYLRTRPYPHNTVI